MFTYSETDHQQPFLDSIPSVSCSTVCCGTSRVIVFFGEELPAEEGPLYHFLFKALMGERSAAEGLKGDHYQFNKVAIVYPGDWPSELKFIFFQLDSQSQRLIRNLECGNLSVGAGMMALIERMNSLDENGSLFARNEGTGQQMELIPHDIYRFWDCDWTVRFLNGNNHQYIYSQAHYGALPVNESESIDYWMVEQGNVFIFVNAHPEMANPALLEMLEEAGKQKAGVMRLDPVKSSLPKIIFYCTNEANFHQPIVEACCFFKGEMHQSLPGSGSMSLASFLTASLISENGVPIPSGTLVFTIVHPSGSLKVSVDWETRKDEIVIANTSFTTSAKLLLHGKLAL